MDVWRSDTRLFCVISVGHDWASAELYHESQLQGWVKKEPMAWNNRIIIEITPGDRGSEYGYWKNARVVKLGVGEVTRPVTREELIATDDGQKVQS